MIENVVVRINDAEVTTENVRKVFERHIFPPKTPRMIFIVRCDCSQRTYDILTDALHKDNLSLHDNIYPASNTLISVV